MGIKKCESKNAIIETAKFLGSIAVMVLWRIFGGKKG